MKRVVTGHSAAGKAVVLFDGAPSRLSEIRHLPGLRFDEIWATETTPQIPGDSADPTVTMTTFVAPAGGTRFRVCTFPPDAHIGALAAQGAIDLAQVGPELAAALPDLAAVMEPEHPGMHTTNTVDYNVVLSGEIWCEMDDGVEVHLQAGDVLVQCGTRHAWHNKGTAPCVMASTMVGAVRP
jgi:mannose-6-phosphate isomerase-like protein (cupin superfamily)